MKNIAYKIDSLSQQKVYLAVHFKGEGHGVINFFEDGFHDNADTHDKKSGFAQVPFKIPLGKNFMLNHQAFAFELVTAKQANTTLILELTGGVEPKKVSLPIKSPKELNRHAFQLIFND